MRAKPVRFIPDGLFSSGAHRVRGFLIGAPSFF